MLSNRKDIINMSWELIVFTLCILSICIIGIVGCISSLEEIDERNKRARFEFNERNRK
jgi:hypothetical protein